MGHLLKDLWKVELTARRWDPCFVCSDVQAARPELLLGRSRKPGSRIEPLDECGTRTKVMLVPVP